MEKLPASGRLQNMQAGQHTKAPSSIYRSRKRQLVLASWQIWIAVPMLVLSPRMDCKSINTSWGWPQAKGKWTSLRKHQAYVQSKYQTEQRTEYLNCKVRCLHLYTATNSLFCQRKKSCLHAHSRLLTTKHNISWECASRSGWHVQACAHFVLSSQLM